MAVPVPPLAEQHRIVAEVERRLSVIQQAETAVEASVQRAERLRQSILKRAFAGELVPQDPDDEPGIGPAGTHPRPAGGGTGGIGYKETAGTAPAGNTEGAATHPPKRHPNDHRNIHRPEAVELLRRARNAGLSYGDYLEQLTYLIFLKMMHELTQPPLSLLSDHQPPPIPVGCDWPSLLARDGAELGHPLPPHPGDAVPTTGHPGGDLQQGAEPHPGTGHADPAGQGAHRQRELARPQRRREGRRLRVAAGAQRPGREDRRRPVLHAASADSGHRGRDAAWTGHDHLRPGLRHRRVSAGRP